MIYIFEIWRKEKGLNEVIHWVLLENCYSVCDFNTCFLYAMKSLVARV